jgi:hypothetical protein
MHSEPREPDLTPRQRWMAARRLAAGDVPVVVAASAGVKTACLQLLLDADPEFQALVAAFVELRATSREAKLARLEDLCWDGAERAILDGRVSTLNLCLRALRLIETVEADEQEDPMAAFLASLSEEERADYEALGAIGEPSLSPVSMPLADEAPSHSPRSGWPHRAEPEHEEVARLTPHPLSPDLACPPAPTRGTGRPAVQAQAAAASPTCVLRPSLPSLPADLIGARAGGPSVADAASLTLLTGSLAPTSAPPALLPSPGRQDRPAAAIMVSADEPVPSLLRRRLPGRAPNGP